MNDLQSARELNAMLRSLDSDVWPKIDRASPKKELAALRKQNGEILNTMTPRMNAALDRFLDVDIASDPIDYIMIEGQVMEVELNAAKEQIKTLTNKLKFIELVCTSKKEFKS